MTAQSQSLLVKITQSISSASRQLENRKSKKIKIQLTALSLLVLWTLACVFKYVEVLNEELQMLHRYGLSPVWVLVWVFKLPDVEKLRPQCSQRYGFSPVWVLVWTVRLWAVRKLLLQIWHWKGLASESCSLPFWVCWGTCVLRCILRLVSQAKLLAHIEQW